MNLAVADDDNGVFLSGNNGRQTCRKLVHVLLDSWDSLERRLFVPQDLKTSPVSNSPSVTMPKTLKESFEIRLLEGAIAILWI